MQKIDFVNSQQPALNDTNLNLMQDYIETAINAQVSGDTLPIGAIIPYASDTIPENWLICNGQEVSRTTYSILFGIIGTTCGVGDGSTTFNLPDLRTRVPVGKDSTQTEFDVLGKTGGEKTHTLTVNEMPSHNHSVPIDSFYNNDRQTNYDNGGGHISNITQGTNYYTNNRGGGQAHNNLQPYITTNYIIKATQSAGVVATVVDNLNSTSSTDALSAKQGNVLKSLAENAMIYCKVTSSITTNTSEYTDVTNWSGANSVGESFTVENGKIKVLGGVSKVKVTVKIRAYHNGMEALYSFIRKNSTSVDTTWVVDDIDGYKTIYNQAIVDVQENDLLTINYYGDNIVIQEISSTILVEKIN